MDDSAIMCHTTKKEELFQQFLMKKIKEIRRSNSPVVTGICYPDKSRVRHHRSLKLGSKLKYLNITCNIQNFYILHAFLLITIALLIAVGVYC